MSRFTKFGVTCAATVLLALSQAHAMTVSWSAIDTRFLTLQGGVIGAPIGGLLQIGKVGTNTVAYLQSLQDNPVALYTAFEKWVPGTGFVGDGTSAPASWTLNSGGPGSGFFSTQIYILTFNASTPAASTQVGLFTSPNWIYPPNDASLVSIDLAFPLGITAVIGALHTGTYNDPSNGISNADAAAMHLIPEPSSVALVGLGLLGAVGMIRRRRS